MGALIRGEVHHWWPRGLSKFWGDDAKHVHRLESDGSLVRSLPKAFGGVSDAHNILLADEPTAWDETFEGSFDKADNSFAGLIPWLQQQVSPIAPSSKDMKARMTPLVVDDSRRAELAECLASQIVRSPSLRHRVRLTTEYYRRRMGMAEPEAEESLVAANLRRGQPMLSQALNGGKFVVLHSGEEEFIFGDGFLHSVHSVTDRPMNPRCLIPITPTIAVLHVSPMQYRSYPRGLALNLTKAEVEFVNYTVQTYAGRYILFRKIAPEVHEAFRRGAHLQFEYHKHPWLEHLIDVAASASYGADDDFKPKPADPSRVVSRS
jgi:hypothetical protein